MSRRRRNLTHFFEHIHSIHKTYHVIDDIVKVGALFAALLGTITAAFLVCYDHFHNVKIDLIKRFNTQSNVPDIVIAVSLAIFVLLLISTSVLAFARYHSSQSNKAIKRAAEEFRTLARKHSYCDRNLFDRLFCEIVGGCPDPSRQIGASIEIIKQDIQSIMDDSKRIFESYTREKCSTSVKLIYSENNEVRLKTALRDSENSASRGHNDDDPSSAWKIEDNSANIAIFNEKKQFYAANNLYNLSKKNLYKNSREGWDDDYDSTIVWDIKVIGDASPPLFRALFCVDSLYGKLDNEMCKLYAEEISFRLGVMMYRLFRVDEIRLPSASRKA